MTLYVYNFDGVIYETYNAFDEKYRELKRSCVGTPKRQVIKPNGKIVNEVLKANSIWLEEEWKFDFDKIFWYNI